MEGARQYCVEIKGKKMPALSAIGRRFALHPTPSRDIETSSSFVWGVIYRWNTEIDLLSRRNLEKIVYTFADFGSRNTCGHGNFHFDRYLTEILK